MKRRIQPGDKMAGRHGNKGGVSNVSAGRGHARTWPRARTVDIVAEPRWACRQRRTSARSRKRTSGLGRHGSLGRKICAGCCRKPACGRRPAQVPSDDIYNHDDTNVANRVDPSQFSDEEAAASGPQPDRRRAGMATPVFDGATE
ncbi:hypothetical protein ACE0DR_25580, partial [Azotobacter sp. CWF10]